MAAYNGIFVTGKDTRVGETAFAGALAGALLNQGHQCGLKPIQMGCGPELRPSDAHDVEKLEKTGFWR